MYILVMEVILIFTVAGLLAFGFYHEDKLIKFENLLGKTLKKFIFKRKQK